MIDQSSNPVLSNFRIRSIGAAAFGGRIDDVEVSETDPNVIYIRYATGGRWKSVNNGVTFELIFDEQPVGSIGDIAIHPRNPDIVYVGTGEPNNRQSSSFGNGIYKTTDGAKTWTHLGLEGTQTIGKVLIDPRDPETVYVAVDGHRSDDLRPHVFVTTDYGSTFRSITSNLPAYGNVQVIREDPESPDLLYVGTEFGLFISLDRGGTWEKSMNNYPTVRTDDVLVHPRDGDLIVGTHGRSVWIADDITPLQQLTAEVRNADARLFDIRDAVAYVLDRSDGVFSAAEILDQGQYVSGQTAWRRGSTT